MYILGLFTAPNLDNPTTIWAFTSTTITLGVFIFIAVQHWISASRKEREAYYKTEAIRRIAEMPTESAKLALEHLLGRENTAEERKAQERKKLDGMRLGGLINVGIGIALAFFLGTVAGQAMAVIGLFPGAIGVALLIYSFFLAPKPQ